MATTTTPLRRSRSMASLAGLDPDTLTAADYLEKFGVIVEDMPEAAKAPKVTESTSNPPNPKGSKATVSNPPEKPKRVRKSPDMGKTTMTAPEVDPFTVTPEEQAAFKRIATSGERHEWLERGAEFLRPIITAAGGQVPEIVRVSISWPWASRKAIGQCWHAESSKDSVREVFVSPSVDETTRVLGVLAHELCHACLGPEVKHGAAFAKLAKGIGLEGKMTATTEGAAFLEAVAPFVAQWGEYPAKGLDPSTLGRKVQTTRLLKCECPDCGYVARVARAWLERAGAPICPVDEIPMTCDAL